MIVIVSAGTLIYSVKTGTETLSGDEVFSYGSANQSEEGKDGWIILSDRTWYENDYFKKYMSADEEHLFDYRHVWSNQEADVHPPLYYAVLHTVCSFFPGVFSIWFAAGINIVCIIISILLLYKTAILLYEHRAWALSICFIYGISCGIIETALFIRMYAMLQMWIIAAVYLHLKAIKNNSITKNPLSDISYSLLAVTIAGTLTHYYFIIFLAIMAGAYCVYRIYQKQWKDILSYCFTMILAVSVVLNVFPAIIHHMFSGYRGTEAFSNFIFRFNFLEGLKVAYLGFNEELFGGCLIIFFVIFIAYYIYKFVYKKERREIFYKKTFLYMMLFVIAAYVLIIAKIEPFHTIRYYMPIYSLCILCVIGMLFIICNRFISKQLVYCIAICALFILPTADKLLTGLENEQKQEWISIAEQYAAFDCVLLYKENKWHTMEHYNMLEQYNGIYCIYTENTDSYNDSRLAQAEGLVVYVYNEENVKEALQELKDYTGLYTETFLYNGGAMEAYFLQ